MDFLSSDISSDSETEVENSRDEIDLGKDVQSATVPDACDTIEVLDSWYIPLTEEDAERISQFDDETRHDSYGDLLNIREDLAKGLNEDPIEGQVNTFTEDLRITEPSNDMLFDSWEDAYSFYNNYAKQNGFSIRIQTGQRYRAGRGIAMKDRPFVAREFVCSKEGFKRDKNNHDEHHQEHGGYKQLITRTGCRAKLHVRKIINSNAWHITEFIKDHNHEVVSPSKSRHLRSHKKLSAMEKQYLEMASNSRMRPVDAVSHLNQMAGGPSNVGFNTTQCTDFMARYRKRSLSVNDGEAAYQYCRRMSLDDPTFYYAIQSDNKGRMTNFFWAEGRARKAYNNFGDVVVFDSTYRKNKYKMPFAPFTGVNHHCRNILFGCALLQDETTSTFLWLFRTWLDAMSNRPPIAIITDQDAAMKAAIKKVFPSTRHCFCIWHILKKFPEHFSHMYSKYDTFKVDLHRCLYKTYSKEEFELCWKEFVERYKIEDHSHVKTMYAIREQWIPAFLRDTFFAGMTSSQRSESANSMFGRLLTPRTTLQELIQAYKLVEEKQYQAEEYSDVIDIQKIPNLKTPFPIEKHAASIYSLKIFKKFQTQLFNSGSYMFEERERNGELIIYSVRKDEDKFRTFTVRFNLSEKSATCSCKMFEHEGILCRHVLYIFLHHQIRMIPSSYILRRWTKQANKGDVVRGSGINIYLGGERDTILRYNHLNQEWKNIEQKGCESNEIYNIVMSGLKRISNEISSIDVTVSEPQGQNPRAIRRNILGQLLDNSVTSMNRSIMLDPLPVSTKGGSSCKRPLSGIEMPTAKSRKCKICHKSGHNRRSCTLLKEGSASIDIDLHSDDDNDEGPQLSFDIMERVQS